MILCLLKRLNQLKGLRKFFSKSPNQILNIDEFYFETIALSEIYNCEITGIDISQHGTNYATKYNSNIKTTYISKVVDKNFLLNKKFDACYAIEFYPFTRTDDLEFQKTLFQHFKKFKYIHLIIYHLDSKEDTVNINIKEISSLLNLKFIISKFHPKIFRLIPNLNLVSLCVQ